MALIIEDGSIVADANSYQSVDDLRLHASLRGVSFGSATDATLETHLIKAIDYLEAQRNRYQGVKVSSAQSLQFPRSGVVVDGLTVGTTEIPRELKKAQMQLAIESFLGNDLQPTRLANATGSVLSEKIDGVGEVVYSDSARGRLSVPAFAKANALLAVLFKRSGLELVRT